MFDLYGNDRLTEWKRVREEIETCKDPFQLVSDLWSRAPFVNPYLDPKNPTKWPDPWHLILDGRYDDLAISLGMLYTFKLTERFMDSLCEIHMSMSPREEPRYFLFVDNSYVLNYEPRTVILYDKFSLPTDKIWSAGKLK